MIEMRVVPDPEELDAGSRADEDMGADQHGRALESPGVYATFWQMQSGFFRLAPTIRDR